MKTTRRAALLGVLAVAWLLGSAPLLDARQGSAVVTRSVLTPAQTENFLLHANIGQKKDSGKGITGTQRATLSDGSITHDASIQTIDISVDRFEPPGDPVMLDFRDSYIYNIGGYRIARLLGLNVPVSVERRVRGAKAAVTWWIDDVVMDENDRVAKQTPGAISSRMADQFQVMRVFDELIANTDRNGGNILWTTDGAMWMIDHTRAFRLDKKLRHPELLQRCERSLCEKMRGLTAETVKQEVGNSLSKGEVAAVIARRDEILKLFEGRIAEQGEGAILYTLPQR